MSIKQIVIVTQHTKCQCGGQATTKNGNFKMGATETKTACLRCCPIILPFNL